MREFMFSSEPDTDDPGISIMIQNEEQLKKNGWICSIDKKSDENKVQSGVGLIACHNCPAVMSIHIFGIV